MKRFDYPTSEQFAEISARPALLNADIESRVRSIIEVVRERGDKALFEYTRNFDKAELRSLWVSEDEINESVDQLPTALRQAIDQAQRNIEQFHRAQEEKKKIIETMPGVQCWRKSIAISPIGIYIPGGSAPLFSTALMLGVPAMIAGCEQITVCTPPNTLGKVHPAILYALSKCGIRTICKVGGAQAIAALAFGTQSIGRVEKIFGPGNQYVTVAKQVVAQSGVAIDMPAGPSEVAVIADGSARANFIAADLIAQAEHGADSQVLFVTTSAQLIEQVESELARQLEDLPRADVAQQALRNSRAVLVRTVDDGMKVINAYAPEHVIVMTDNSEADSEKVSNAGSVFIGSYSPETVGDYASGTNHTLPTNGHAARVAGLSLDSFVRKVTFQHLSRSGLRAIAATVETMAIAEGLEGHRRAVAFRMEEN